jgi:AcrR family transcriptional regulator
MSNGKQRLIDAAFSLFSAHGYNETSSRDIAERAGVSLGLIHKHFNGMKGLLAATDERALLLTQKQLDDQLAKILVGVEVESGERVRMGGEAAVYLKRALTSRREGSDELYSECLQRYTEALEFVKKEYQLLFTKPLADCALFLISLDIGMFALAPLSDTESDTFRTQVFLVRKALLVGDRA